MSSDETFAVTAPFADEEAGEHSNQDALWKAVDSRTAETMSELEVGGALALIAMLSNQTTKTDKKLVMLNAVTRGIYIDGQIDGARIVRGETGGDPDLAIIENYVGPLDADTLGADAKTERTTGGSMASSPEASAFQFATEVMERLVGRIERHGAQNAYVQLFQPENATDDSNNSELEIERLDVPSARRLIGRRIQSGFRGRAAFSCLEEDARKMYLRVEAFNTSDGRSASARLLLRRTLTGKLKAAGSSAEVDDFPTIPDAFPLGPRDR